MSKNRLFDDLVNKPKRLELNRQKSQQINKLHHELDVRRKELLSIKKQLEQAEYELHHDALTGLFNRSYVFEKMDRLVSSCGKEGGIDKRRGMSLHVSFVFIDLDHFKKVNDTYGHEAGDNVLRHAARLFLGQTRGSDIVARWGGEEMVVCLIGANQTEATAWAERARYLVERTNIPTGFGAQTIKVTASFGVAGADLNPDFNAEKLIKEADLAMYLAKNAGRNQVVEYDPSLSEEAQRNSEIYKNERRVKFLSEVGALMSRVPILDKINQNDLTEEDMVVYHRCHLAAEMEKEIYQDTIDVMQSGQDDGCVGMTLLDRVWEDFYFYTERLRALGDSAPESRLIWCEYMRDMLKDAARGQA